VTEALDRTEEAAVAADPEAIEAAFDRLWSAASQPGEAAGATMRLRVLNVIAIAEGADGQQRFDAAMATVVARHPCRAVLVKRSAQARELEARVSARWQREGRTRREVSEEVVLTMPRGGEQAAASVVLALLAPDVPVALWMMDAPEAARELRDEILEHADRVVMDSSRGDGAAQAWAWMLRERASRGIAVADLAWERLATWRELTAQLFDEPEPEGGTAGRVDHVATGDGAGGRDIAQR
jgi:glucose-6-phosphate dehydrogenase assembly protein OpcA